MSKKLENDIRMAEAVQEVLNRYEHIWQQSKGFSIEVEDSRALMGLLEESRVLAQEKSQGATETKADLRAKAMKMCLDLAGRADVYAKKQHNTELREQLKMTPTDLKRLAANKLVAKMQSVANKLKGIGPELELYDVTKEDIERFKKLVLQYKVMIPKPRDIQVTVKSQNHSTADFMDLLRETYDNMDKLITKMEDKKFLNEYATARMVIELGSRHDKPDEDKENKEGDKE